MVSGNKSNSKIDSVWNLLSTPGYHEFVGSENIYKSEMNLAHTSTKDFQKSVIKKHFFRSHVVLTLLPIVRTFSITASSLSLSLSLSPSLPLLRLLYSSCLPFCQFFF